MLLSQISGRSGRHRPGEVIIQGYKLDHYAIQSVLKDYEAFYKEALYERKLMRYEPFMHVSQFLIEGQAYLKTYQVAFMLKKKLSTLPNVLVLGPSQALIKKIKDRFRFVVTIKYKDLNFMEINQIMNDLKQIDIHMKYFPNLDMM
jgi:primosomal protein N' (replication factor Y)